MNTESHALPHDAAIATAVLEMRGITKRFNGVAALQNVNLTIYPGEVHALMGENGAGKSTLMKILAGAYIADEGEIFIDGRPANITDPSSARRAGINLIYQELNVAPNLTVAENIFMGSELRRGQMLDRGAMPNTSSSGFTTVRSQFYAEYFGFEFVDRRTATGRNCAGIEGQ
jgi:ribose transport system ATP-binding protein